MMQASVVIATRNRAEKLGETLARLGGQEADTPRFEVVVVDDGSEPPLSVQAPAGVSVRLLRQAPLGRSAARNYGAAAAAGELLIFIDDDIWVAPDFVKRHLRAHEPAGRRYVVGAIRLPESCLATPFGRFRQQLEDAALPGEGPVPANFCAAGNFSIQRAEFLDVGGFDNQISSGEDQDLALRVTRRRVRGIYAPDITVVHRDEALDLQAYCRRVEWGYRQIHPFVQRHAHLPANQERAVINGPLRPGREPAHVSMRKIMKSALQCWPLPLLLLASTQLLERCWPGSALLPRSYRLLVGLSIFRGYRAGLRGHVLSGGRTSPP